MTPPIVNSSWPDDVYALYKHDMQEIWNADIARHIWNQYHNQLNLYLSIVGTGKSYNILDVGCAQATLALILAEAGHDVVALDMRQQFLEYAKSRYTHGKISFVCGNILEIDMSEKFDVIFANQIIEHLVYPVRLIERLVNMLRPGGRLIVTTPNGDYLVNDLPCYTELGEPEKWEHKQFSADGDGHFFAYTAKELENIFNSVNSLSNIHVDYFETPWVSGHMKIRYLHSFIPLSLLQKLDYLTLKAPWFRRKLSHQLIAVGHKE